MKIPGTGEQFIRFTLVTAFAMLMRKESSNRALQRSLTKQNQRP